MTVHYRSDDEKDFNKLEIEDADGPGKKLDDYYIKSKGVSVHFRDIEDHIIDYISKADAIVGCVAWMTSRPILKALSKKEDVKIIVQKEDFLRPDGKIKPTAQNKELRKLYNSLNSKYGYYPATKNVYKYI